MRKKVLKKAPTGPLTKTPTQGQTKPLFTKLKPSTFKRMKLFAARQDKKIAEIVEAALDLYLNDREIVPAKPRADKRGSAQTAE